MVIETSESHAVPLADCRAQGCDKACQANTIVHKQ